MGGIFFHAGPIWQEFVSNTLREINAKQQKAGEGIELSSVQRTDRLNRFWD
jgi:hypothetical protein